MHAACLGLYGHVIFLVKSGLEVFSRKHYRDRPWTTLIKMFAPKISNKEKWSRLELRSEIIIATFQSIQVVVVQAIYLGEFTKENWENVTLNSSNDHDKIWRRIDRKIHAKNPEICCLQKRNFLWKFPWKINSKNGFLYLKV